MKILRNNETFLRKKLAEMVQKKLRKCELSLRSTRIFAKTIAHNDTTDDKYKDSDNLKQHFRHVSDINQTSIAGGDGVGR